MLDQRYFFSPAVSLKTIRKTTQKAPNSTNNLVKSTVSFTITEARVGVGGGVWAPGLGTAQTTEKTMWGARVSHSQESSLSSGVAGCGNGPAGKCAKE